MNIKTYLALHGIHVFPLAARGVGDHVRHEADERWVKVVVHTIGHHHQGVALLDGQMEQRQIAQIGMTLICEIEKNEDSKFIFKTTRAFTS